MTSREEVIYVVTPAFKSRVFVHWLQERKSEIWRRRDLTWGSCYRQWYYVGAYERAQGEKYTQSRRAESDTPRVGTPGHRDLSAPTMSTWIPPATWRSLEANSSPKSADESPAQQHLDRPWEALREAPSGAHLDLWLRELRSQRGVLYAARTWWFVPEPRKLTRRTLTNADSRQQVDVCWIILPTFLNVGNFQNKRLEKCVCFSLSKIPRKCTLNWGGGVNSKWNFWLVQGSSTWIMLLWLVSPQKLFSSF